MPYQVAPTQINELRKAFADKNGRRTFLHDADITELVNENYRKAATFKEEFSMVVDAMLAKEAQYNTDY